MRRRVIFRYFFALSIWGCAFSSQIAQGANFIITRETKVPVPPALESPALDLSPAPAGLITEEALAQWQASHEGLQINSSSGSGTRKDDPKVTVEFSAENGLITQRENYTEKSTLNPRLGTVKTESSDTVITYLWDIDASVWNRIARQEDQSIRVSTLIKDPKGEARVMSSMHVRLSSYCILEDCPAPEQIREQSLLEFSETGQIIHAQHWVGAKESRTGFDLTYQDYELRELRWEDGQVTKDSQKLMQESSEDFSAWQKSDDITQLLAELRNLFSEEPTVLAAS